MQTTRLVIKTTGEWLWTILTVLAQIGLGVVACLLVNWLTHS